MAFELSVPQIAALQGLLSAVPPGSLAEDDIDPAIVAGAQGVLSLDDGTESCDVHASCYLTRDVDGDKPTLRPAFVFRPRGLNEGCALMVGGTPVGSIGVLEELSMPWTDINLVGAYYMSGNPKVATLAVFARQWGGNGDHFFRLRVWPLSLFAPEQEAPRTKGPIDVLYAALDRPLEGLELSVRSANCLGASGFKYVGQVVQRTEDDWLKSKNFGRKSLKEIKEVLQDISPELHFGMTREQLMNWEPPALRASLHP